MEKMKSLIGLIKRLIVWGSNVVWKGLGLFFETVTVKTKHGIMTVSTKDNVIAKTLVLRRQFQFETVESALSFLRKEERLPKKGSGTVLDIGANIGMISIGMVSSGEFEKSIAIEPEPGNYSLLTRNVQQNGLSERFLTLQYAVSDKAGEVELELSNDNAGDHRTRRGSLRGQPELCSESLRRTINVMSDTLDNLIRKSPEIYTKDIALIWIDVQGFEGYVFLGGEAVFANDVPVCVEIWPYGISKSGMEIAEFINIIKSKWSTVCVMRRGRYIKYPISFFEYFIDELGLQGEFDDVILLK